MAVFLQQSSGVQSISVAGALSRFQFLEVMSDGGAGIQVLSGDVQVAQLDGIDLTVSLAANGIDAFLSGGTVTGLQYFERDSAENTVSVLQATGFSVAAAEFDQLFFGRPGHALDDAVRVAQLIVAGDDQFNGSSGFDTQSAGDGNDRLNGADSIDFLSGGRGNDRLWGGTGNDRLAGESGRDLLFGGDDDDLMLGGASGDVLDGGEGADALVGGAGRDKFVFSVLPDRAADADTIVKFRFRFDSLQFDSRVFDGLRVVGDLDEDAFSQGARARDAEDRIIYHQATGRVFYDEDGTGNADSVLVLRLSPIGSAGPRLTLDNIDVI